MEATDYSGSGRVICYRKDLKREVAASKQLQFEERAVLGRPYLNC